MSGHVDVGPLIKQHRESSDGQWGHLARAVTAVENALPWAVTIPAPPHPIQTVGITGPPGVGKSTLVARLIESYAEDGAGVGVIFIDPSSVKTRGAILGDRVRVSNSFEKEKVFMRSVATRGAQGAIASTTSNVAAVLAASGSFDIILVETVGAGQSEVMIASMVDSTMLVTAPGLGDSVQSMKSGVMECADLIVVNMADRPGADDTARQIKSAIGRRLPVVKTVATGSIGIDVCRGVLDSFRKAIVSDAHGHSGYLVRHGLSQSMTALRMSEEWLRWCLERDLINVAGLPEGELIPALLEAGVQRWKETMG